MNEGRIMQEGSPYDIYHHPANIFVAEFIGDPGINFLKVKLIMASLNVVEFKFRYLILQTIRKV